MGLALVHGIVESHGGKIFIESKPGKGSVFHIYFPGTEKMAEIKPGLPIILCTGYSSKVDKAKAKAIGAKAIGIRKFASKPLDNRELAVVIRQILDGVV